MIITLTTDFGLSDPFVGIMKGVILGVGTQAAFVACVIGLTAAIHRGVFDSAFAMVHGSG